MEFRIADTFTDSLARLTGEEQKAVKTTAFDLQMNLAHPGLQFHKLDRARDPRFASVRVGRDVRLIVHRTQTGMLLCYVDHHDAAYAWAERRKLETHPATGAAQLVEIRETVQEIAIPKYIEIKVERRIAPRPPLFESLTDQMLLSYGVPTEWLADVKAATDDSLLTLADHLPREAAEALLELATGGAPQTVSSPPQVTDPFEHPDALRRFRTIANVEELELALDFPWDKWTVFLHPQQRSLVERDYSGPARVSGSAGTGKTVVAVHRAVHLARAHIDGRVLLTTFSDPLAAALRTMTRRLVGNEPRLRERLEVESMRAIGLRLYERLICPPKMASASDVAASLRKATAAAGGASFSERFIAMEWEHIVDAWQVTCWDAYRDVPRLGRKTRLPEKSRAALWTIFEAVQADLRVRSLLTESALFTKLAERVAELQHPAYEFTVIDESQDVSVAQLRFLVAMGASRPNGLFFSGDIGQRIFAPPFSWKSLGADVRGRSFTLRINYRTSHQIRTQADRLLGSELSDVDGIVEKRRGTISTFNGPGARILSASSADEELAQAAQWLAARIADGIVPGEIGVFVRHPAQFERAHAVLERAGIPAIILDDRLATNSAAASLCTMHLAKGLEFRAVAVIACDDYILPWRERLEATSDEADLAEAYASERHLLYVACTRARDRLFVSGVEPVSEFLEDLKA